MKGLAYYSPFLSRFLHSVAFASVAHVQYKLETSEDLVGDQSRLPAGVYSVYIIPWGRETMAHFTKMTLTVK